VDVSAMDVMLDGGEKLQITSKDIESLQGESDTLRSILNNLTEGVVVANREGKFVFFNPAAERIMGIGPRDVDLAEWTATYGCYREDRITPYQPEELPLARALCGEEVFEEVLYIRNLEQPGGHWISTTSRPLLDEEGELNGGVVIFREIRERQYREEAEKLARAVEQTADSVVISNTSGIIEYVNPAFEETTGYSREEALGKTPSILKSGFHDETFYKDLWGKLLAGEPFRGTILNKKKNGELYWAEQTITPIKDNEDNITNFVSVLKDVTELKAKHEQDFQLGIARKIQQEFYPSEISVSGFDIAGAAFPANETGGDYFDYIMTPDGYLWIVQGDVGGHGISAALIMAETRAYLRSYIKSMASPGEVLEQVNQELTAVDEGERFVTMILAQFDPRHQTLRYANAGHVPGYLLNSSGEVLEEMSFKDLPLGILRGYNYSTSEPIPLQPGYVTAILTDGITEAMNFNNEVFGSQRAIDLILQHCQLDAIDIINRLYQSVQDFSENQAQEDDITMVICKTTEPSIKDRMMR
jgi:sigma-B regulation protein RsbU (phosphoserine phosphatase)